MKRLRLADLANLAECSESLLSKIENGKSNPSLSLLHRLAQVLETSISWFFTSDKEESDLIVRRDERMIIPFDEFRKTEGTTVERIVPHEKNRLLQALIFIIEPGGHSLSEIRHEGEDFGYVLEGEVEIIVDGESHSLAEGDTFQFRSERPHGYRNPSASVARILWINTPPTY